MSEVLVVAELVDGAVTKPTLELLTLARRLGDPVAVVFGDGADAAARRSASTGRPGCSQSTDPAIEEYLVAPKAEALAQIAAAVGPGGGADQLHRRGQGDRRPAGGQAGLRPDHRRDRHRRRRHHDPVGVRRQLDGSPPSVSHGMPGGHGQAERRRPGAGTGAAPAVERAAVTHLRRGQERADRGQRAQAGQRPARADRGRGRGLRRSRHRRRLRRASRQLADALRRRGRCLPGRRRLGLVPARLPGRADRQDRLAAALRRGRHLRGHPAPGRDADLQGDRRGQQGRRGADLRPGRPRRGRRPAHRAARGRRGDQAARTDGRFARTR